jgi:UDP-N-acetylglucosamine 2-epimerase (non-hydrolysing)
MHDILLVSGTRPEIIKLAPVYHALRKRSWARVSWLHTGQHGARAGPILGSFGITPDYAFERHGTTLDEFGAHCRAQLGDVMRERPWHSVIVQGDTESTFLGALAGFYHRVPVSHVEAGLRTHNLDRPFPEEGLRQMISRIARHQFAPTARARDMLLAEAVPASSVELTGNTVVDAQKWLIAERALRRQRIGRGHILVTVHRRENWGEDVARIFHAVADIARRHPEADVLFPVHLNPLIQGPAHEILGGLPNVSLTAPLDYFQMQQALIDAWLVLSDSGGLQEEAPTFGVPLLVLREETERPEAIEAGCARLVGTDRQRIVEQVCELWDNDVAYEAMHHVANPFGDGLASERIADTLARSFGLGKDAVGIAA